ncbi:ABC transporter permease, partial [Vibrio cholerae]
CALPVGMVLGTGVAALSISKHKGHRWFATVYTTVLRGLPELLTLFIIYHGVGLLINKTLKWLDPSNGFFELNPFGAGVIALDDLMRAANIAVGATKKPFLFYLTVCLAYWAVCVCCERVLAAMEVRSKRGIRVSR